MEENKKLISIFFKTLKCELEEKKESVFVKNIPEDVQKRLGLEKDVKFVFNSKDIGFFINENSELIKKIKEYLKSGSSKTLLRIDFDFPENIKEKIKLRNCSISKIEKKQENNYFSRFSFLTNFRYINKVEQVMNEIFVHEGKVVSGNLNDYKISEGDVKEANTDHLSKDYQVSKESLKEKLSEKINSISKELKEELDLEIKRVDEHFELLIKEKENKFSKSNDEASLKKEIEKIIIEKNAVIQNEKNKCSLNVENKLIDTTIIYYPIFKILISLDESGFKKNIELKYNPLTQEISNLNCDSCGSILEEINVCHGGHICCVSCLHSCSECGKRFCKDCFKGICDSCGKLVCKNCANTCSSCQKLHCKNCMRKISRTGIEKCKNCITYCPVCSEVVEKKGLVKTKEGISICKFCFLKRKR